MPTSKKASSKRASHDRPKAAEGSGQRPARNRARARSRDTDAETAQMRSAPPQHDRTGAVHTASHLVTRGKDAISDDAGGIAAAVAVGLGAALMEAELLPGILLGAGAMLLGRVFPQLNEGIRPMLKSAIGASLSLTDKTRSLFAEATEQVHDVVAEVRAERQQAGTGRKRNARGDKDDIAARGALPH